MTINKENLIIIMSDEHQGNALECLGHPFVKTPNLDKLAENGVIFSNAYTSCPICVPARASFATGLPVHKNRLWDNAMPYYGQIPSWGHRLQSRNISVESIGKLHYRSQEDDDGFDKKHIPMMVVNGVGMVWGSIRRENERKKVYRNERMLGNYIGPGNSKYTEYDEAVVLKTIEWLEKRNNSTESEPWCLYVGLVAPHFPLVVPQKYFDMYPRETLPDIKLDPNKGYKMHPWIAKQNEIRNSNNQFKDEIEKWAAISAYFGLCTFLDDNIGKIMQALKDNGFMDNTNIIYTSDHGDNVGVRGLWGKSNFYEESCSIPLILSGPKLEKDICKTPVTLMDVSETITDHFSCPSPNKGPGETLYKILKNKYDDKRIAFSEYHASSSISGAYMIRKGKWKYIYYVGFDPELFDLEQDPEEMIDLSQIDEYKDILNELKSDLYEICDPEEMNKQAFIDQDKMIEAYGGIEAAGKLGASGATPPPK